MLLLLKLLLWMRLWLNKLVKLCSGLFEIVKSSENRKSFYFHECYIHAKTRCNQLLFRDAFADVLVLPLFRCASNAHKYFVLCLVYYFKNVKMLTKFIDSSVDNNPLIYLIYVTCTTIPKSKGIQSFEKCLVPRASDKKIIYLYSIWFIPVYTRGLNWI